MRRMLAGLVVPTLILLACGGEQSAAPDGGAEDMPPGDGGAGGDCTESTECTAATAPICDQTSATCRACSVGDAGDAECADREASTPYCGSLGRCLECLDASHCSTGVCDQLSGRCAQCTASADCASELCDAETGSCVDEGDVVYVSPAGADGASCGSLTSPCLSISRLNGALDKITELRRWLHLAPGSYTEGVNILTATSLTIVGHGAVLQPSGSNQDCFTIANGAQVVIEGLRLHDAAGGILADGIECSGGSSTSSVELHEVTIEGNEAKGVYAHDGCNIVMERSTVRDNGEEGLYIAESDFSIVNSNIVDNGATESGVYVYGVPPSGSAGARFDFNTVAGNGVGGGFACFFLSPIEPEPVFSSNIVWGNGNVGTTQVSCPSSWTHSDIQGGATGTGNIDLDPVFASAATGNYHLAAGSPCLGAADPAATLDVDIDGDPRPQGGGRDMGADERVEN